MKALEILQWICDNSVNGEFLSIIEVPMQGIDEDQQNRAWWERMFGFAPVELIEDGKYLYFYSSQIDLENEPKPDAHIVLHSTDYTYGEEVVYLYKID